MNKNGCSDCEYCDGNENGMDCKNTYALPENGAPHMVSSDPNDCPFFELRVISPSCRTCEYITFIDGEFICVDNNPVTLDYYCNDYSVNCELCTHVDGGMCSLKGIPYIKRHEDTCKDFKEVKR